MISEVTERLQADFAAKNILVENQVPESLPLLKVDRPKFYRLFELLLKDEIASLPAGSRVRLSARPVGSAGEKQQIEIVVSDNGPVGQYVYAYVAVCIGNRLASRAERWSTTIPPRRLTLRRTRPAATGFARVRRRVNSSVRQRQQEERS